MIAYIINFILCSGLLLLVYHLFLQGERMYRFNRFYLLGSLVFSLVVPFISITSPFQPIVLYHSGTMIDLARDVPVRQPVLTAVPTARSLSVAPGRASTPRDVLPLILTGLYVIVFPVMLYRFGRNLYRINRTVKLGVLINHHQSKLIITSGNITPHSFLNYIFINSDDYSKGDVVPEIIRHEQAHIDQRHSLDILFIELLQVICWFNPLLYFYRRAILLNHEFLADEAVLLGSADIKDYQYLLLAQVTQASGLQLTSQFNYQSTKKRLMMMTKTSSLKMMIAKKLAIVPVMAIAVLLFSQKTQATMLPGKILTDDLMPVMAMGKTDTIKKKLPPPPQLKASARVKYAPTDAPQSVMDAYAAFLKKYDIPKNTHLQGITATDKTQMEALYVQMSKSQQDSQPIGFGKPGKPLEKNTVTAAQLEKWQNKDYFVRIDGSNNRLTNEDLAKFKPEDFDRMSVRPAGVWAFNHNNGTKFFVDLMTKPYYADYYKKAMADRSDIVWELRSANAPKPKVDQVRFPPPIVKPDAANTHALVVKHKPKVTQIRFPPPIVKPDSANLNAPAVKPKPKVKQIRFPPPIVRPDTIKKRQ